MGKICPLGYGLLGMGKVQAHEQNFITGMISAIMDV